MGHYYRKVFHVGAGTLEYVEAGLAHALHGLAEDFLPIEIPTGLAERHTVVRIHGAHATHAQNLP